jgi:hypothetical protein
MYFFGNVAMEHVVGCFQKAVSEDMASASGADGVSSSSALSIPADPGVVDLRSCMHEMHVDERRTCESMVRGTAGSIITPMPTHHIDEHGR